MVANSKAVGIGICDCVSGILSRGVVTVIASGEDAAFDQLASAGRYGICNALSTGPKRRECDDSGEKCRLCKEVASCTVTLFYLLIHF